MSKEIIKAISEFKEQPGKIVVSVNNVSVSKNENSILNNISFTLREGEHVALVGANGAGKTTLLKTIIGEEQPNEGKVFISKGIRMAYVPQSVENIFPRNSDKTVLDYFYSGKELAIVQQRMEEIETLLGKNDSQTNNLIKEYESLQMIFEYKGGYSLKTEAVTVMQSIGLSERINLYTSIQDLSGGEKTKLFLAQALLSNADLLLLDEPSNHLGLSSVAWLNNYLKKYKGAILMVSHQANLIDVTVQKVIELENQTVQAYSGNYSDYITNKTKRKSIEIKRTKQNEAEIKKLTKVINRLRAGNRAKTSKDRQRKLKKILEKTPRKKTGRKFVKASFEINTQSGQEVLKVSNLRKNYGEKVLDYSKINLNLQRGEKVGIIGPVGAGKTTLLKMVAGIISPDSGKIKLGCNVDIGYYSQEMENLNLDNTVLEEVTTVATGMQEQQLRSFLGSFLFSNEEVFKKVEILSLGEKSRLMLAKLALKKHNFLILDEPSNHLDTVTRNLIAEKLKEYPGTILLVSHDEKFMNKAGSTKIVNLPSGKVVWL